MNLEEEIKESLQKTIKQTFQIDIEINFQIPLNPEFGDRSYVCINLAEKLNKNPNEIAQILSKNIKSELIKKTQVQGHYLNIYFNYQKLAEHIINDALNNKINIDKKNKKIMIEFCSPNTNKPLHLGHLRNICLGDSLVRIFQTLGHRVIKANLVNDRGIHICKSIVAYQKWGNNETPKSSNMKGDYFVGKYYVMFENEFKKQKEKLNRNDNLPIFNEAKLCLKKWEERDNNIPELKEILNIGEEKFQKTF